MKAAKQLGAARKRGGEAASDAGGHPYDGGSVRTTADQPQSLSVIGNVGPPRSLSMLLCLSMARMMF